MDRYIKEIRTEIYIQCVYVLIYGVNILFSYEENVKLPSSLDRELFNTFS